MESINDQIYCVRNNTFPSNTYLLKDRNSNLCIIIDPGLDEDLIDQKITELNLTPIAIISTHGHFDHLGGVSFLKDKYNIPFYLHEDDLKLCNSANFYLKLAKIAHKIKTPVPDHLLSGKNGIISIGRFELSFYNFAGHSNGSCIIKYDNFLFSGDIIYKNGLGFNNFPGENKTKLAASIREIFATFPESSFILPGHGEAIPLKEIKNNNQELKQFLNTIPS